MKINSQFVLRSIAGEHLLIPTGAAASRIQGLLALNETGVFLYEKLCAGSTSAELTEGLCAEYDVSPSEAAADVEEFLNQMRDLGIVEEDDV